MMHKHPGDVIYIPSCLRST